MRDGGVGFVEEVVVEPRVPHIVHHGGEQESQLLLGVERRRHIPEIQVRIRRLHHVACVDDVVVWHPPAPASAVPAHAHTRPAREPDLDAAPLTAIHRGGGGGGGGGGGNSGSGGRGGIHVRRRVRLVHCKQKLLQRILLQVKFLYRGEGLRA